MRQLGVSYPTDRLAQQKLMQVMVERDGQYKLAGYVYLGGELVGDEAGRGTENFVAAISFSE